MYICPEGLLLWPEKKGERIKLHRYPAVRPFNQAESQRLMLLLGVERVSERMSLMWLTISKTYGKINCIGQCAE